MKKLITLISVILIVGIIGSFAIGCVDDTYNDISEADGVPKVLQDTEVAPEQIVADSVVAPIQGFIDDTTLSVTQKIQKIMDAVEENEMKAYRFTYFNYTIGTTSIGDKSGTLIYQRLRKQNLQAKDDTTLKLPINHNFGAIEVSFVRNAAIRYNPPTGNYFRMQADGSAIKYDEETGLLSVANSDWEKHSSFNVDGDVTSSQNREDMKKTCVNWSCENIVSADGAKIEKKTNADGAIYYEMTFIIDTTVANSDQATIDRLQQDNSGKNMSINYINMTVQVWQCGLLKAYTTDESWNGKIGAAVIWYEGAAESKGTIVYSYSERDNDMSNTESIRQGLL